jgi:hypothetical protein
MDTCIVSQNDGGYTVLFVHPEVLEHHIEEDFSFVDGMFLVDGKQRINPTI